MAQCIGADVDDKGKYLCNNVTAVHFGDESKARASSPGDKGESDAVVIRHKSTDAHLLLLAQQEKRECAK